MENRDYKKDITINESDLQNEVLTQPSRVMEYGELLADAVYERDQLKSALEHTEARLENLILENWEKTWDKFPSEAVRRVNVVLHKDYKIAVDKLNKANYNVNILKSAEKAFEHRKKSLEMTIHLLLSGFHSEVKTRKEADKTTKHFGLGEVPILRKKIYKTTINKKR